ncbi:MAG: ABC transporter permease [Pseudomonadota bacterium]
MQDFSRAFSEAFRLISGLDAGLVEIVLRSLGISLTAVAVALVIALPIGALLAVARFPGRGFLNLLINSAMGLPPVVVGLVLYLLLSQAGAFGALDLLYTPWAMILAQTVLILPIVAAITRQIIGDLHAEYDETLRAMQATKIDTLGTLLWDARPALTTAALVGLGRALSEVGAVMIVGGNIDHVTRVMTTAIALETSRGELALALALGIVLLILSLVLNAIVAAARQTRGGLAHA